MKKIISLRRLLLKYTKEVNFKQNFNLKNYIKKNGESQVMLTLHSQGKRKRLMLDVYIRLNFGTKKPKNKRQFETG